MTRHRLLLLLLLQVLPGSVLAADQGACPDPRSKSVETELAGLVGRAVLYPMDGAGFERSVFCLIGLYARTDVSLSGLTWDAAHALLRIMAADPVQFFRVVARSNASAVERWIRSLDHAASWPGEACPRLDPITIARLSIEAVRLDDPSQVSLHQKVLDQLKKWPCRVAS